MLKLALLGPWSDQAVPKAPVEEYCLVVLCQQDLAVVQLAPHRPLQGASGQLNRNSHGDDINLKLTTDFFKAE